MNPRIMDRTVEERRIRGFMHRAVDQNGVDGLAAAPLNSTELLRVRFTPPRIFSRPAYIGSLSKPSDDGAKPIANEPTTRCWPATNEVEM